MEISLQDLKEFIQVEKSSTTELVPDGTKVIVVLQRGWVAVGDYYTDCDRVELRNASVVRRWGTEAGLGQLAEAGPLPDTVLDAVPQGIRFHVLSVVAVLPCNLDRWGGE